MNDDHLQKENVNLSWVALIRQAVKKEELLGSTCKISSTIQTNKSQRCCCGRLTRKHSFDGDVQVNSLGPDHKWEKFEHATIAPVTVFGILQNKIKFVRFDQTRLKVKIPANEKPKKTLSTIAQILLNDMKNKKPTLLISCYGGAKYFKMSDKLEKKFMDGIGQAAATEGVWLLSTGLNSGVSKVIGQSVWRHKLLTEESTNCTVIGLTSWGCLSEETRDILRRQAKINSNENVYRRESIVKMDTPLRGIGTGDYYSNSSLFTLDENQLDTLETNHTHLLLLDDGSQGDHMIESKIERFYITDKPRSIFVNELITLTECHSVTIIIEGGLDSISVIANDLYAKRPVVIVHGSGRLANVIGDLLELTRYHAIIGVDEIKRQLKKIKGQKDIEDFIKEVEFILTPGNRPYLNVFKLDDDKNLTDTIFSAVFKAQIHREKGKKMETDKSSETLGDLLDLSVDWNYVHGIDYVFENKESINRDSATTSRLFEKALISNRPIFVDYFLRRQYNVLETSDYIQFKKKGENTIEKCIVALRAAALSSSLFDNNQITTQSYDNTNQTSSLDSDDDDDKIQEDSTHVRAAFGPKFVIEKLYAKPIIYLKKSYTICSLTDLDNLYYRLIGPYAQSFFRLRSTKDRIQIDLSDIIHYFFSRFKQEKNEKTKPSSNKISPEPNNINIAVVDVAKIDPIQHTIEIYSSTKTFDNEEMLRDIFLWSVVSGHAEMSFILLLQVKSRIVASLIAAGITGHFRSTQSGYLDQWHKFQKQSKDYELFAKSCIDDCYKRSERRACQLLLREIPLFGNITCMQVAITFRLKSFINTRCFDQVLNRQWNGTLNQTTNKSLLSKIFFIISILSFGTLAPLVLDYRNDDISHDKQEQFKNDSDNHQKSSPNLRWEGIQEQNSTDMHYLQMFREFHRTPLVRMTYHFLFYIWMVLVFSYMMLFKMKSENTSLHWTEIYIIITISAMLIEDIRKIITEYRTQMLERWHISDIWIVGLYILPYLLFYIGIGLKYGSINRPDLFTPARIVLALDLELWFLFSLRFVSAIKLLGPKLFMIRNMLRDLIGFIYIIFVCMAAYGVVSQSLTMYNNIEFTARNLSTAILYRPYWFLYSIVDDEKNDFDNIINSPTSTSDVIAEATTNQVLLAFHMLFINILILNLLIAVFNFTITDVQEKSDYFWRYQRYELIREYFEKPFFAYPPLSLLAYLYPIFKSIFYKKNILRIFKRYGTPKMNKDWTDFENAATFNHARTFVDRMYRDSSTLVIPSFSETDELKMEIDSLKHQNNEMRNIIDKMDIQSNKVAPAMNWMMNAMNRVKMSKETSPPFVVTSVSDD